MSDKEISYEEFSKPSEPTGEVSYEEFLKAPEAKEKDVPVDVASSLGAGMAKSVFGLPGVFGDIQQLARKAEPYIGIKTPEKPIFNLPTSEQFIEAWKPHISALSEKPTTTPGKYAETVGEFITTPTGIAKEVGAPLKTITKMGKEAVVPALASEAAGQLAEGTQLEAPARIAGAIAGGAPFTRPSVGHLDAAKKVADTAEAATRAGVELPYFVSSESIIPKALAMPLKSMPLGAGPIFKRSQKAIEQLGEAAEGIHKDTGELNVHQAGEAAKAGLLDWIGPSSTHTINEAYDAVNKYVNPDKLTQASSLSGTVQELGRLNVAANLPEVSPAMRIVMEAATNPQGLTYDGIKRLRTKIGGMLDSGILPADVDGTELKKIYGALTNDLKASAENAGGQKGLAAFNRANQLNRLINERRESLAKIVGLKGEVAPEQVLGRIEKMAKEGVSGDINRLLQARKSMRPHEWEAVSSGLIGKMGRDVEGNFSPNRFITEYSKLSDAGKTALFGVPTHPVRESLEDILKLSSKFKELDKFANPSGTAQAIQGLELIFSMLAHPFLVPGQIGYSSVLSRILSNPVTAKKAAKLQETYINLLSKSKDPTQTENALRSAYQAYESSVKKDLGAEEETRIARATGGSVRRGFTVQGLISAVEAAKKHNQKTTEKILSAPDESVVHALKIANNHI
jgi:hypothetical protein